MNAWIRAGIASCATFLACTAMCQSITNSGALTVVTVCELLENRSHYADTPVAVIGRYEQSNSIIDHYEFLAQDGCDPKITTQEHVWPNRIMVWPWPASEAGMPKAPSDTPTFSQTDLAEKLLLVRKTSKLGVHKEPRLKKGGGLLEVDVPNDWVVAYGRIMTAPDLSTGQCGEYDCRGFHRAPLILVVERRNVRAISTSGIFVSGWGLDKQ